MKIAFAGAGYIINIHAKAAQAQKDVELCAVIEKFPEKAAALARKFGIKNQYETVEQMLGAGKFQIMKLQGGLGLLSLQKLNSLCQPSEMILMLKHWEHHSII